MNKIGWFTTRFKLFRKAYKESMIRSALADRIISHLNILRRGLNSIILSSIILPGILSSYFLYIPVLGGTLASYSTFLIFPSLMAAVQSDLNGLFSKQAGVQELAQIEKPNSEDRWIEDLNGGKGVKAAAYVRVSTDRQAQHGYSLEAQEKELRELAEKVGISRLYWFCDAGKSGVDFDRRKLNLILDLAEKHEIVKLLVVDIDRLGRNSRRLLGFFSDLRDYGVTVQTPEGEIDVDQLEDLLVSAIKAWAAQHDNERRAKAAITGRIEGFKKKCWNKPVPLGYLKKPDKWIEKKFDWGPVIKDVFDLFLRFRNFRTVKDAINKKYGLNKPLTRHQVTQFLKNPVYAGKPEYPGRVVVEDPNLAFIDWETFEKAQEFLSHIQQRHSHKKRDALQDLVKEYGFGVLEFIPNVAVLCPDCQGVMVKNGMIYIKGHTAHNYLCKKCGRQRKVPTKRQIRSIQDWVQANQVEEEGLNTKIGK